MIATITNFESASLSTCQLRVKRLNADKQEETVEYTLVMDFNAIAQAQSILDLDLTDVTKWQNLNGTDITVVCWCALNRFHPEVTLTELREVLTPAQSAQVCNMLLEMCFPGILERITARMAELGKEAEKESEPKAEAPRSGPDPTSAVKS